MVFVAIAVAGFLSRRDLERRCSRHGSPVRRERREGISLGGTDLGPRGQRVLVGLSRVRVGGRIVGLAASKTAWVKTDSW